MKIYEYLNNDLIIQEQWNIFKKMKSQIIPSFDSPGYQISLGMTKKLADIMMMYGSTIKQYGVVDPTLDKTYQVLESILRDLYLLFRRLILLTLQVMRLVRLDGIKDLKLNYSFTKIIQSYYRKRQNQLCKEVINAEQDIMYPFRIEDNLTLDKDDIIHWWGYTDQLPDVANKLNRIILIDYFPLFIDAGFENAFGNPYLYRFSLQNPKLKENESFLLLLKVLFKWKIE